ncbi:TolC family protein [Rugamonas rubra]|nr:TolC family protein [Rugamonas rubra]
MFLLALGRYDAALAGAPVGLLDAVRLSLANNVDVLLQRQQVDSSAGALQQAGAPFDSTLRLQTGRNVEHAPLNQRSRDAYASQGFPLSQLRSDSTNYSVALERLLPNGVVLSPSASVTRAAGSVNDINQLAPQNNASVDFSLRIQLQKNSGRLAGAGASAAERELAAAEQDLRFALAQTVLRTVQSYWGLLAAGKSLQIARESEASVARLVEETAKLIAADELPAADLHILRAKLFDRGAARLAAEQALLDARQRLGVAMGLAPRDVATLSADDDFPAGAVDPAALPGRLAALQQQALRRRADLKAAQLRRDAAATLSGAAREELKPQLDLTLRLGYAGLAEGSGAARALSQNRGAPNVGVSLSYQWPLANNGAEGRYRQQLAGYQQHLAQLDGVERAVALGVEAGVAGLVRGAAQLRQSEQAAELYRLAGENERTRYRLGSSTMINVLTTSDSLLNARLGNVAQRLNYLNALVQLNFQTGALIVDGEAGQSVGLGQLLDLPPPD